MKLLKEETDETISSAIAERFPTLRLVADCEGRRLVGAFPVWHDGAVLGEFKVEVDLTHRDKIGLPTVREVGGRIPQFPDRHVNPADGTACLYLPAEFTARQQQPLAVVEFLDGPVQNFFLGQLWVEEGMGWPFGEHAHGASGTRRFCAELIGVEEAMVPSYLGALAHTSIKGHWPCPCGSGRKLRACHREALAALHVLHSPEWWKFLRDQLRDGSTKTSP